MKYIQPDFYKFSQDSIILAEVAAREVEAKFNNGKENNYIYGLDLCAGSGVVGLETLLRMNEVESMKSVKINLDFYEKGHEFKDCIEKNISSFEQEYQLASQFNLCIDDIKNYKKKIGFKKKYDFIVSNPPYFLSGSGRAPSDQRRGDCRFWGESERRDFLDCINWGLKDGGLVIMSLKEDWVKKEIEDIFKERLKAYSVQEMNALKICILHLKS